MQSTKRLDNLFGRTGDGAPPPWNRGSMNHNHSAPWLFVLMPFGHKPAPRAIVDLLRGFFIGTHLARDRRKQDFEPFTRRIRR